MMNTGKMDTLIAVRKMLAKRRLVPTSISMKKLYSFTKKERKKEEKVEKTKLE